LARIYTSASESETEVIGREIAKLCDDNDFVALFGDMGSGKTVFMRGFVAELVPEARVSSPTYAIVNVYEGEKHTVNHFDMYRITSEDDLYSTGFEEIIQKGITVTEWSENIVRELPSVFWRITFEKKSETERVLHVERIGYDNTGN